MRYLLLASALALAGCSGDDGITPRGENRGEGREYRVQVELRAEGDSLVVDFGSLEVGGEAFMATDAGTRKIGAGEYVAEVTFYGR